MNTVHNEFVHTNKKHPNDRSFINIQRVKFSQQFGSHFKLIN